MQKATSYPRNYQRSLLTADRVRIAMRGRGWLALTQVVGLVGHIISPENAIRCWRYYLKGRHLPIDREQEVPQSLSLSIDDPTDPPVAKSHATSTCAGTGYDTSHRNPSPCRRKGSYYEDGEWWCYSHRPSRANKAIPIVEQIARGRRMPVYGRLASLLKQGQIERRRGPESNEMEFRLIETKEASPSKCAGTAYGNYGRPPSPCRQKGTYYEGGKWWCHWHRPSRPIKAAEGRKDQPDTGELTTNH